MAGVRFGHKSNVFFLPEVLVSTFDFRRKELIKRYVRQMTHRPLYIWAVIRVSDLPLGAGADPQVLKSEVSENSPTPANRICDDVTYSI